MKKTFFRRLCLLIMLCINGGIFWAQNIVPNPGFETFTLCPTQINNGEALQCAPWYSPTNGSSDYYNACAIPSSNCDVPMNGFGNQAAHTGVAYVGIEVWLSPFLYREYVTVQLTTPMLANTAYEVEFYVSLADNTCGTDKIGAYFSVAPPPNSGTVTMNVDPQLSSNLGIITDKTNWTLISGCVVAQGGEQYITIGNFFNDAETNRDIACGSNIQSYYYIDDVSVIENGNPGAFNVDLGGPVEACATYTIDPGYPSNFHYHWDDGSINPTLTVTQTGTYMVTISDGCSFGVGTIDVMIIQPNVVEIGPAAVTLCEGMPYTIALDPSLGSYTWQDGSHSTQYTITDAGLYSVTLDGGCAPTTDQVTVNYLPPPPPQFLGPDQDFCPGEQIVYDFDPALGAYHWQNGSSNPHYTILHSGTYALTITNVCGVFTDEITVEELPPISVDIGPNEYYLCEDEEYEINLDPDLGSFLWQDGNTGSTYTISDPGSYSVVVTNQCESVTDQITVFQSVEPTVDFGDDLIICQNETPYTLNAGNNSQVEYDWQDGSGNDHFLVTTSGTYSVTISNSCYSVSDEVNITVQSNNVQVILPPDQSLCEGESFIITNAGDAGDYVWQDNSTDQTLEVNQSGTYTLIVTTQCGVGTDDIEVQFYEPAPFPELGPDISLCPGEQVTLDPQLQGVSYEWQDHSTADTFLVTTGGIYTVVVSTPCNSETDNIEVEYLAAAPLPDLGPDQNLCPGQQVILTANASGNSYVWQDLSTADTLLVTSSGNYAVTISSACGDGIDTVSIQYLPPVPIPDLGPDASLCPGEQSILSPHVNGVSFLWQDMSTADTLLVSAAGMYFVQISNQCGAANDTIEIEVNNNPPQLALPDQLNLCQGSSLIIESGISGVNYLWNDNSQSDTLLVTSAGNYSLTVSNACGMDVDTIHVLDGGPSPHVELGIDVSLCVGETALITPEFSDVDTWLWSDGTTQPDYAVTGSGQVTVQASNSCGTAYDTLNAFLLPATPPLDLGNDTSLCSGNSFNVNINTPNVSIVWSDGSVNNQFQIQQAGTYYATISNACGSNADTIHVTALPDTPVVNLGMDQTLCPGETIVLDPGDLNVNYEWQDGSINQTFSATDAGIFYLTATNACGSDIDSVEITISTEGPHLDLGPDILACEGENVTLMSDISGVQFIWQDGSTDHDFIASASGIYYLQVSNNCGSDIDSVEVELNGNAPATDLGMDTTLCDGLTIKLNSTAESGTTILWQDGSSAPIFDVTSPGLYWIEEENHCGENTDSIQIDFQVAPLPFDLGADTILCPGESISLMAPQQNANIIWQDGTSGPTMIANQSQVYSLMISNDCGTEYDEINLSYDDRIPVATLPPVTFLCPGDVVELNVEQPFPASYLWSTGATAANIHVDNLGTFSVNIQTNCFEADAVTEVMIADTCVSINSFYIPNAFTPNGDLINDVFTILPNDKVEILAISARVFDRWGNMVYQASSLPVGWKGDFNGEILNPGVYVYRIELRYMDNSIERNVIYQGDVTLVR